MTAPAHTTPDAHQALIDLFAGWLSPFPDDYALLPSHQVPQPFHKLLVHHHHMTVVLREHYGVPVHLTVQSSEASGNIYRRRITLNAGPAGPLVELGVVRLDLSQLPASAQQEILAQKMPLGQILINHNILRRIQPHHYLRIPAKSPLVKLFNLPTPQTLYGRIGTIFCNELPTIELLEIVTANPAAPPSVP